MVRLVEDGTRGTFNAVGPCWGRSFAEFLHGIRAVTTAETRFVWADTAQDTLEYHFSRPPERQAALRAGMKAEKEAELLAAWRESQGG